MYATEFVIKNFETNYPEIVKSLDEWAEFSIKKNWEELRIVINQHNVNNCPDESLYGIIDEKGNKGNLRYHFLKKIVERLIEYLQVKGFQTITTAYPASEQVPQGGWQQGILIQARYQKSE